MNSLLTICNFISLLKQAIFIVIEKITCQLSFRFIEFTYIVACLESQGTHNLLETPNTFLASHCCWEVFLVFIDFSVQPPHSPLHAMIIVLVLLGSTLIGATTPNNPSIQLFLLKNQLSTTTHNGRTEKPTVFGFIKYFGLDQIDQSPNFTQSYFSKHSHQTSIDITKFYGKLYKGLPNHVMMFHLWLSSKNIIDDSIFL